LDTFSDIGEDIKTVRKLKYRSLRHEMYSQFSTNIQGGARNVIPLIV